jgi:hypothetical protein
MAGVAARIFFEVEQRAGQGRDEMGNHVTSLITQHTDDITCRWPISGQKP